MRVNSPRLLIPCVLSLLAAGFLAAEEEITVPPKGVAPFDPKPLMAKVAERIQTDKYRFAVVGDTKHAPGFISLVKYIEDTVKPDFVLTTGDMVAKGGGSIGPGHWEKLAIDSGETMRKLPWWPAIGNHEISGDPIIGNLPKDKEHELIKRNRTTGVENFKKFYNLQQEYYSFEFRNAVFITLPFPYPSGATEKWLEGELKKAAAAKKHIFVYNHAPFFTVGGKIQTEIPNKPTSVTKLFTDHGVRAVFSGHDHGYYRTVRDGIPYIISAGGGATLYGAMRRDEGLPEDVYYFAEPETWAAYREASKNNKPLPAMKYLYHVPGKPDRIADERELLVVVVDVDGDKITSTCFTAKSEKLDEMTLSK